MFEGHYELVRHKWYLW